MRRFAIVLVLGFVLYAVGGPAVAADPTRSEAEAALRKAVDFYRNEVSCEGGYLWRYSADLDRGEGEKAVSQTTAWVQAPGTPAVGEVMLSAYELTGEVYLLEGAREAASALVRGQLRSGGWDYRIEFAPADRQDYAYRVDGGGADAHNVTTLDDNTTQGALRFLMRIDKDLKFEDQTIHEAVLYALDQLMAAQYPNGAWPQRFSGPPDDAQFPVREASYEEDWPRKYPKENYRGLYTLNDNVLANCVAVLLTAADTYGDQRYREAAKEAGRFVLRAQMPDPQPAWAQQYNAEMHPAWARRFEPAAITGGESQGAMRVLLDLYDSTADRAFLEPIPAALGYLEESRLPDGRLARFYELESNRPLYFTKDYQVTYEDNDLPTHYSFKVKSKLEEIRADYDRLLATDPAQLNPPREQPSYGMSDKRKELARTAIDTMDERGAWVEKGKLKYYENDPATQIIASQTFITNVRSLSRFIAASK
jgi:hypothetical protein